MRTNLVNHKRLRGALAMAACLAGATLLAPGGQANTIDSILGSFFANVPIECDRGVYPVQLSAQTTTEAGATLFGGSGGYCIQFYNFASPRQGATATNYIMRSLLRMPGTSAGDAQWNPDTKCSDDAENCVTVDGKQGIALGQWPGKSGAFYWSFMMDKLDTVTTEEWKTTGVKRDENCVTGDDPPTQESVEGTLQDPGSADVPGTQPIPADFGITLGVIALVVAVGALYYTVCVHDYETKEKVSNTEIFRSTTLSRFNVYVPVGPVLEASFAGGDYNGHDTWDTFEAQYRQIFGRPYDSGWQMTRLFSERARDAVVNYDSDLSTVLQVVPGVEQGSLNYQRGQSSVRFTLQNDVRNEAWPQIRLDWEAPEGLNVLGGGSQASGPAGGGDIVEYALDGGGLARVLISPTAGGPSPTQTGYAAQVLQADLEPGTYAPGTVPVSWESVIGEGGSLLGAAALVLYIGGLPIKPPGHVQYDSAFNLEGHADPTVTGDAAAAADGAVVDITFDIVPQ